MVILQAGLAKSGNFWLYKILQNIITYGGLKHSSFIKSQPIHSVAKTWNLSYKEQADIDVIDIEPHQCFYRISSIFRMPIENIDDYINQCSLVWTHSPYCATRNDVYSKFGKIVYIIRDPRDVIISKSRFAFTPYMKKYFPRAENNPQKFLQKKLTNKTKKWVQEVGEYLKYSEENNIHILFYERLLHSFDKEMQRLLVYLELEANKTHIQKIKQNVDFSTMKRENPSHVRTGRSGGWTKLLTDEQKREVLQIAKPMLKILNYPVNENNLGFHLPALPPKISKKQIDKAIAHSNRITFIRNCIELIRS